MVLQRIFSSVFYLKFSFSMLCFSIEYVYINDFCGHRRESLRYSLKCSSIGSMVD